ncbi:MAG TPA: ABC transporter permease [Terriglobales bacterium]|nr:ABC transporter permease [Terriglobales bacterium]
MLNINPKHIWIVARREYLERVRTKAFIIMTILTPALMFAFAVVPTLISLKKTGGERKLHVVTSSPELGTLVKEELQKPATREEVGAEEKKRDGPVQVLTFKVEVSTDTSDEARQQLQKKVTTKEIDGFLWVTKAEIDKGIYDYTAQSTSDFTEMVMLRNSVNRAIMRLNLGQHGITGAEFDRVTKRLELEPITWKDGKAVKGGFLGRLFSSMFLMLTLYITVLMYGMNVMRAVLEEKTSRIMEVLMSALTPAELLAGKIIGVGAVGITQIMIWIGFAAILSAPGLLAASPMLKDLNLSAAMALYFAVFYLLGFLLYSAMFAAVGSMVNSEQEAQQLQFFVMLPMIISTVLMMLIIKTPNDPVAVAVSLFPFTAPLLMYLRIVVQQPPFWQIALSIGILVATIAGVLFLCARIYRVGVLMYGKKPTLPEILKWIRYA